MERLTEDELSALEQCGNGCDVLGYGMARHLRAVERKRPELIDICPAMGEYGVKDKHPYFGAISTAKGKREVEAWRKRSKKGKAGSSTLDIETVISRDGGKKGKPTGGSRVCGMEGCSGRRIGVRWSDGKLTWPCTKAMQVSETGEARLM